MNQEKRQNRKILSGESKQTRQYVTLAEKSRAEAPGTEELTVESDVRKNENTEN